MESSSFLVHSKSVMGGAVETLDEAFAVVANRDCSKSRELMIEFEWVSFAICRCVTMAKTTFQTSLFVITIVT